MSGRALLFSVVGVALAAAGTSAAGDKLPQGQYRSSLTPAVNEKTADKIETQVGKIQEISSVDVKPKDSSLHFTVKDNAQLELARLKDAVERAVSDVEVGDPLAVQEPDTSRMGTPQGGGY